MFIIYYYKRAYYLRSLVIVQRLSRVPSDFTNCGVVNRLSLVPDTVLGHARWIVRFVDPELLGICGMLLQLKKRCSIFTPESSTPLELPNLIHNHLHGSEHNNLENNGLCDHIYNMIHI